MDDLCSLEESKKKNKEKEYLISRISSRIDQHMEFLDAMEQVRWRFTSAFGLTALVTILFLAYKFEVSPAVGKDTILFAYFFAILISFAGLVTQVRIIGIFWGQWHRIRELQRKEASLLKNNHYFDKALDEVWMYPDIEAKSIVGKYFLTVHGANCMLFSALLSVATTLMAKSQGIIQNTTYLVFVFIAFWGASYYLSQVLSKYFINTVKKESTSG